MNRTRSLVLLLGFIFSVSNQAFSQQEDRNLLTGSYSVSFLEKNIADPADWVPFPDYKERQEWDKLSEEIRSLMIGRGELALDYTWPVLTATLYLKYDREGDRTEFQNLYFERRKKLHDLLLAELIEGEGRYLDQITNGVWAICEESSWCIPAHINLQENGFTALPRHDENVVDLFAAETSATLAWVYYFLKDELHKISPEIVRRMKYELSRRILIPVLERNDFWWMGLNGGIVNNWNPWIISNWLAVALLVEDDRQMQIRSIAKALTCLDQFINVYPADGGCDEGPGYWGHAAGSMFDALELLYLSSGGTLSIYDKPLIRNMGSYIYKAYIHDSYFINFADASAIINLNNDIVFRYGQRVEDEQMSRFAAFNLQSETFKEVYAPNWLTRAIFSLFSFEKIKEYKPEEPLLSEFYLPDLEVFGARSEKGSPEGFFIAAKGGHNDESHNHNDVGNFILYYNGFPAIIDVGVENYSRKTFSSERYTIWTMQSAYHNLPTINGNMQKPGREFKADNVTYNSNRNRISFSVDITMAYPVQTRLDKWQRVIIFERGKSVRITENYTFFESPASFNISFMSAIPVSTEDNRVVLDGSGYTEPFKLNLIFDQDVNLETEPITITDSRLKRAWGDKIYRVIARVENADSKGVLRYRIQAE